VNNAETAAHMRHWAATNKDSNLWPTEGCGQEQHARFVDWRLQRMTSGRNYWATWGDIVLEYAGLLESGELPEVERS